MAWAREKTTMPLPSPTSLLDGPRPSVPSLPPHQILRLPRTTATVTLCAIPPLFLAAAAVLAMPEPPRWLVLHSRPDEARRVLARTAGTPTAASRR